MLREESEEWGERRWERGERRGERGEEREHMIVCVRLN
jgi:hypothetical protein